MTGKISRRLSRSFAAAFPLILSAAVLDTTASAVFNPFSSLFSKRGNLPFLSLALLVFLVFVKRFPLADYR
jgi:hypothetical protein